MCFRSLKKVDTCAIALGKYKIKQKQLEDFLESEPKLSGVLQIHSTTSMSDICVDDAISVTYLHKLCKCVQYLRPELRDVHSYTRCVIRILCFLKQTSRIGR